VYPLLGVEIVKYIKSFQPMLLDSESSSIWRMPTAKLQTSGTQKDENGRQQTK